MNIYIICPVRILTKDKKEQYTRYVTDLRADGHTVFFPPEDAPQDDTTGINIINIELEAIRNADEVHVFWNVNSKGSHFDLGAAMALGKLVIPIHNELPDNPDTSYWKVMDNYFRKILFNSRHSGTLIKERGTIGEYKNV